MNQGLVTVYIPTRGDSPLLRRAVESVMAQTYQNIEIIIVVDSDIYNIDKYLAGIGKSSYRCFFHGRIKGANAARNLAVESSAGQYITGLDDDDYFLPDRVENLLENYSPELAFVCSDEILEFDNKERKFTKYRKEKIQLEDMLLENCATNQVFTETYKFKEVGLFDPNLPACQDYDMWMKLILKYKVAIRTANPSMVVDKSLMRPRISNQSKKLDGFKVFFERYKPYMNRRQIKRQRMRLVLAEKERINIRDFVKYTTLQTFFGDFKRLFGRKSWI
ncbi:glycosyltransferase [Aestuariicella hydrocarbonica]|uniref:Glycosyltransferase n=1 Tax=Pseudomaricurvus hydrocarbonicus TaxID=1470433 RepID=A0A9E5JTB6_9GAMM|nr:glycosyltransferase [Aestuariicella hydrocarbonica]NHO65101.1 glycosyltransferase [Aestuariicella hydrocarbonica]